MGKKVNLYLDNEMLTLWSRIPSGQRSAVIQNAIREYAGNSKIDPKEEIIMKLKEKIARIETEEIQLQHEKQMLVDELQRLQLDLTPVQIDKNHFFRTIVDRARILHIKDINYRSFTGKSYYRIHDVVDDKIYIRNMRTGRKNSNFSKKTVDLAIDRLITAGGKIPVGQFIPVKMHEYTVVNLHPQLYAKDGLIFWDESEMVPVDRQMVPENYNLETPPPKDWQSNDHWLAVTIDGHRAHMCMYIPSHPASDKITFTFIDDHPHFQEATLGPGTIGWWGKYYTFNDDGFLSWGHHSENFGSTQTILTMNS